MNLHNNIVTCYDILDELMKSKTINKTNKQKLLDVHMEIIRGR